MPRTLSEQEYNAVREQVLRSAPSNMDEATFTKWVTPTMAAALHEAELVNPKPEGSAVGRFVSNAAAMLNPVEMAKGVYQAATHPVDTVTAIGQQMGDQWTRAGQAAQQGHYSEAVGHAAAGTIPVIGPMAAQIGEQAGSGDIAGAAGGAAGLLAPALIKPALKGVGTVARTVAPDALKATIAERMNAGAAGRVADVMSPKVGANKARFGRMAEEVAPQLAKDLTKDGAPMSRAGLHVQIADKLADAESALDAAANARNGKLVYHTKPILADLQKKRAQLTAQTVRSGSVKAGENVVPGPNAARVAVIDQAIDEIERLGPVVGYDPVRLIRQAYDGPAKAIYSPAVTADYMKAQGGKMGAADVTGVLRDHLAKFDPPTADANAYYSLYRKASDVLEATAEVERTRPKVGRQIMARLMGTVAGEHAAGLKGAIAGYLLTPIADAAMNSGATTKLQAARLMTQLADAIRNGQTMRAYSLSEQLKRAVKLTGGVTARAVAGGSLPATGAVSQTSP